MRHWLKFLTLLLTLNITGAMLLAPAKAGEVLDGIHKEGVLRTPVPDIWSPAGVRNAAGVNSMASTSR